jgi:hypothetical protein
VDQERDEDALCERKEPWAAPSWPNRGEAMSTWPILGVLMVVGIGLVSPALGDEWKDEFWDGPCRVKVEATRDEDKEEVKCDRHH